MTTFYAICAAVASIAWIAAEAKLLRTEKRLTKAQRRLDQAVVLIRRQRAAEHAQRQPSFRYASDHIITRILSDIDQLA